MNTLFARTSVKKPTYKVLSESPIVDGMGRQMKLSVYSDGEIMLWSDEGFSIVFDDQSIPTWKKALQLIPKKGAIKEQRVTSTGRIIKELTPYGTVNRAEQTEDYEIPSFLRNNGYEEAETPEQVVVEAAEVVAKAKKVAPVKAEKVVPEGRKLVLKEGKGWGATVYPVKGTPLRFFYDKRDNARAGQVSDKIGKNGRVA